MFRVFFYNIEGFHRNADKATHRISPHNALNIGGIDMFEQQKIDEVLKTI